MTRSVLLGLLAVLLASPCLAQSTWALTPYRVAVDVTCDGDESLAGHVRQSLAARAEATMGARWRIASADADASQLDKRFTIELRKGAGQWEISARELDLITGLVGPTVRRDVLQPAKLIDAAWDALLAAYRPTGQIVDVQIAPGTDDTARRQSGATVQLRAGRLPGGEFTQALLSRQRLFQPILCRVARDGRADAQSRVVPWTVLVAERADEDGRLTCRIETGLRAPLPAHAGRRTQRIALMIRPQPQTTTLQVLARTGENEPLPDLEILREEAAGQTTPLGLTDRRGRFVIPTADSPGATAGLPGGAVGWAKRGESHDPQADGLPSEQDGATRPAAIGGLPIILLVRSGERTLARLPVVPGMEETLTAYVPDDRPRLRAEAFCSALGERLIDVALRREILMQRARLKAEQGELAEARRLVNDLTALPTRDWFARRVTTYRRRHVEAAERLDPTVRRQVERLLGELDNLIASQLDPIQLERLRTEIAQATNR